MKQKNNPNECKQGDKLKFQLWLFHEYPYDYCKWFKEGEKT